MLGEERRKHIRIFLPGGQVRLTSGPLLVFVGKVVDISVGGIKFISEAEFSEGETLDLEIKLPGGVKYICSARIIHVNRMENKDNVVMCGAQFTGLSETEQKNLGELIMRMRAEQDDILKDKFK